MELLAGIAQVHGFVNKRCGVFSRKVLATPRPDKACGTRGDEHADTSAFFEDSEIHEEGQALAGGGGVDAVEGCELIRGRRLGTLSKGALNDGVLR